MAASDAQVMQIVGSPALDQGVWILGRGEDGMAERWTWSQNA